MMNAWMFLKVREKKAVQPLGLILRKLNENDLQFVKQTIIFIYLAQFAKFIIFNKIND